MQSPLTANAILAISTQNAQDIHPLVQVVDIRQIGAAQSTQERFRLVLSDGTYLQQAMLATQMNELIKSGSCLKNSCVRLKDYICNTVQNKKIIIVLHMEVEILEAELFGRPAQVPLGDDKALGSSGVAAQQPVAPAPVVRPPPPQQPCAAVSNASGPAVGAGGGNSGPDPRGGHSASYNSGMPSNSAQFGGPPQGAKLLAPLLPRTHLVEVSQAVEQGRIRPSQGMVLAGDSTMPHDRAHLLLAVTS